MSYLFLATTFEDTIWVILFIVFSISIYVWTKRQIGNELIAILITGFLVFLLFYRYPSMIWLVALAVFIYYIFGSNIKSGVKSLFSTKK